ncbi:MAG: hypothetical protein P4L85_01095 [Paludisphaera borealis]|uniref:hypothetical protein n=1 Tax=Paludisphaera borealis TaxID=1387353 RepID=UPI00283DD578|nr:hypothetical protein [Paludisphaera borealis]MDR3617917.1 hypothetical protein [Paludisphaera borealis]
MEAQIARIPIHDIERLGAGKGSERLEPLPGGGGISGAFLMLMLPLSLMANPRLILLQPVISRVDPVHLVVDRSGTSFELSPL